MIDRELRSRGEEPAIVFLYTRFDWFGSSSDYSTNSVKLWTDTSMHTLMEWQVTNISFSFSPFWIPKPQSLWFLVINSIALRRGCACHGVDGFRCPRAPFPLSRWSAYCRCNSSLSLFFNPCRHVRTVDRAILDTVLRLQQMQVLTATIPVAQQDTWQWEQQ